MSGTKHIWIDGPDGLNYHCPICGISRGDDHGRYNTCESFILCQAEFIEREGGVNPRFPTFEGDVMQWERFLEERDLRSDKIEFDDEEFVEDAMMGYSFLAFLARLRKSLRK